MKTKSCQPKVARNSDVRSPKKTRTLTSEAGTEQHHSLRLTPKNNGETRPRTPPRTSESDHGNNATEVRSHAPGLPNSAASRAQWDQQATQALFRFKGGDSDSLHELVGTLFDNREEILRIFSRYHYGKAYDPDDGFSDTLVRLYERAHDPVEMPKMVPPNEGWKKRTQAKTYQRMIAEPWNRNHEPVEWDCITTDHRNQSKVKRPEQDLIDLDEAHFIISRAANKLSPKEKQCLMAWLVHDNYKTVAKICGTSYDSARVLVSRALGQLRKDLRQSA